MPAARNLLRLPSKLRFFFFGTLFPSSGLIFICLSSLHMGKPGKTGVRHYTPGRNKRRAKTNFRKGKKIRLRECYASAKRVNLRIECVEDSSARKRRTIVLTAHSRASANFLLPIFSRSLAAVLSRPTRDLTRASFAVRFEAQHGGSVAGSNGRCRWQIGGGEGGGGGL